MLKDKNKCSGCSACLNICPKDAIKMEMDNEGFLYPMIDESSCINCHQCEQVCPSNNKFSCDKEDIYAAQSKSNEVLMESSSGGIFYELAKYVLSKGGKICGARFDSNNHVYHTLVDNEKDLYLVMKSKYMQSKIGNIFKLIKKELDMGTFILFSGTTCQVNGLNLYLKKKYENLISVDIICHGVPSEKIFDYYLESIEKNDKTHNITNLNFRDKQFGWQNYGMSYELNGKKTLIPHSDDLYFSYFLSDIGLRPSCYVCSSKGKNRYASLTLADFWGAQKYNLPFNNIEKGVSLVIIHDEIGKEIFDKLNITFKKMDNNVLDYNQAYNKSAKINKNREIYMSNVNSSNFIKLTNKYCKSSFLKKIKNKIKNIIKNINGKI